MSLVSLRRSLMGWKDIGRTRLLWLGGAIALILIGLALAYFSPPPAQSVSGAINVPLPPAGGGKAGLLKPAPDPNLVEDSPNGPLPIIGKDGRQPWQVYARPFDTKETRPRIALIVTGIGLDQTLSQAALDRLPGPVTFGFDPYADNVTDNIANARSLGHEALLGLPFEPLDYPRQDPGPLTLLTSLDASQNTDRLMKLMGKASGYIGFVAIMGARFEGENSSLLPVLENSKASRLDVRRQQGAGAKRRRTDRDADEARLGGRQQRHRQRERPGRDRSDARGTGDNREAQRRRARYRRALAGAARPRLNLAPLARWQGRRPRPGQRHCQSPNRGTAGAMTEFA